MTATRHNIQFRVGSKFEFSVEVRNRDGSIKDLTGYSGRMQVRKTADDVTKLVDATTANGMVTINAPGGVVTVTVGADVTAAYTWNTGVYDLEVFTVAPAEVIAVAEGFAALLPNVTR